MTSYASDGTVQQSTWSGDRPGERWMGLDLGSQRDSSAFVVVEPVVHIPQSSSADEMRVAAQTRTIRQLHYYVRAIARSSPGTPYPATIDKLAELTGIHRPAAIYFDGTGVGVAVGHMIEVAYRAGRIWPRPQQITITGGQKATGNNLPKQNLVSLVIRALEEMRLHVDPDLPGAPKLAQELRDFRVTAGRTNDVYGNEKDSQHDDLVVALALALIPAHRYRLGGEPPDAVELSTPADIPSTPSDAA